MGREKQKVDSPEPIKRNDGYKIAAREATSRAAIGAAREDYWHRKPNLILNIINGLQNSSTTCQGSLKIERCGINLNTEQLAAHAM